MTSQGTFFKDRYSIDLRYLPVEKVRRGDGWPLIGRIGGGLMVSGMFGWLGYGIYLKGLGVLLEGGVILLAAGLFFGYLILRSILTKEIIHITKDRVHYRRKRFFRWTEWEKPMSDFKMHIGLALNRENTDSVYLQADKNHWIRVFEGEEYDARNVSSAFAKALNIPNSPGTEKSL